jgi:hypothetical protein
MLEMWRLWKRVGGSGLPLWLVRMRAPDEMEREIGTRRIVSNRPKMRRASVVRPMNRYPNFRTG